MQENHKKMSCPLPGYPGGGQLIFLWCKAGECERGMRATGAACTVTHSQGCRTACGDLRLIWALGENFPEPVLCIASLSAAML